MKASRIPIVLVVGAIFVAIGVYVGFSQTVLPKPASADAVKVDTLFSVLLALATIIFLIVEVGIIASIILFRHKPGDDSDGPADHGNMALEVTWTAIPSVIVVVMSIYSFQVFVDMQTPKNNELVIPTTAQQFAWTFAYPYEKYGDLTDEQNAAANANMISNELVLPVNRAVRVELHSKDVMHAFFVPEFRIKQDAIPGNDRVTIARFTPSDKGNYSVVCTELCGAGHSVMYAPVRVVDQAEYDAFIAALRDNARKAALDPRRPERGKQLVQQKYPCGSCHALADAGLTGAIGPNLTGVATRAEGNVDNRLTASNAKNAEEYIRTSMIRPSVFLVPGYNNLMPQNYNDPTVMPEDDREAIINYLLTQK